jgi:hypothetical protein
VERQTIGVQNAGCLVPGGTVEAQSPGGSILDRTSLVKRGIGGVRSSDGLVLY